MEKRITNTSVIKRTITNTGSCSVNYRSESGHTYIWRFRRADYRFALRAITNSVAESNGDLTYSDALILHELVRCVAGDDL